MTYPQTKTVSADVIAADGAVCIGCEIKDGKIMPALAAAEKTDNEFFEVSAAGYSAEAGVYAVFSRGKVYCSDDGLNFSPLVSLEASAPFLFEERSDGKRNLYIAGDGSCVYCNSEEKGAKPFGAGVKGGVMRRGRLFCIDGTDGYKLRWSCGGNAFDFTESIDGAGWAYPCAEAGEILNLVNFKNRLVAVCRHGLAVISAFGTPENFKVEEAFTSLPEIFADTAAAVCGKLYFFTERGLYAFDGSEVFEVEHSLSNDFSLASSAAVHGNLYLAAGRSAALNGRAVLAYNAETGKAFLIDFPADRLVCGGGIYCYSLGAATVLKEGEFTFISGSLSFESGGRKHLNRIEADCDDEVEIEVFNGRRTYAFKGVKHALSPDICGVSFKITVKSNKKINAVRAYAEVIDGV